MVAIITGNGYGLERSSLALLGAAGTIGNAQLGRGGQNVYVNAATGTLNVGRQDEFLVGRGPDQDLATEFSTGHPFWHTPNWRAVYGLTGTVNTAGSTITRSTSFNDVPVYTYDVARGAYVNKEGAGAHDEVRFTDGVWSFTDGDTRTVEYYEQSFYMYKLVSRIVDADGNTQTYTYDSTGGCIARITNADGSFTEMTNTNWRPNEIKTSYLNAAGGTSTMTRVRYNWDPANIARLLSLTVDLTPEDNSIADGNVYRIEYGYSGSTQRLTSITQTDGSRLDIAYDANGRVQSLTETISAGVTSTTSLSYDTANRVTTVTDGTGQATQLWYDAQQRLTKIVSPPATTGAAPQTQLFAYDADGNVTSVTDPAGNVTSFQYDSNGNEIWRQDSLGNVVTRTYGAKNELLTETRHEGGALSFTTNGNAPPTITGNKILGSYWGWWGSATTTQSYTGTAFVSGRRHHPGNGYSFIGLTDGPLSAGAPYNEYDYSYYIYEDGIRIWENGSQIDVPVPSGASDNQLLEIEYDGSRVVYRIGGNVVREVATTAGRTFRGAVSTLHNDRGVQDFTFAARAPETTRFVYDVENHLRYAVGAEGDVTEYRYNGVGQRVAELVYTESAYNISGLSGSTAIAEVMLNSWVSTLTDKSAVQRTNTYYDERGEVSRVVSYSALSQFGEGSESPLAITPGANTTVAQQSDGLFRITKTSGASYGWDADAHSSMKVEGDFVLRLRPGQSNRNVVAGLAKKPGGSASYTNLDYGFYFTDHGPLYYMEQGVYQYLGVYYNPGDNLWIARTGTTISYYKGATFDEAVAAGALRTRTGAGETLYFDSSFHETGAVLDVGLTPRGVVSGWNTTVTPQADGLYRITKTSGSTANWDGDARGTAKAEGDFVLQLRPRQTNANVVGGVSTAPHAHASYENVEFGFYFTPSGEVYRMESGYYTFIANYAVGDNFWLVRTGSTINYYKGATLEAAIAAGTLRTRTDIGGTFYFDSSFYSTGSSMDVAFTPALVGGWNTSVAPVGDGLQRITKTSGSTANWDGDARSTAKADGDFVLRLRPGQTSAHVVGGVSTAPDAHASYENVEFGFYFINNGAAYWMESGYHASLGVNYAAGDNFWLVRTGTTINYYKGSTLEAAMAAGTLRTRTGIGGTFYFDSSFYSTGAVMDVAFAPAPAPAATAPYSRTDFVYNQAGQLIARITEGQRPETFVYDGLGRVVAATDRNQGTTSIVFNDAATRTLVTLASGLVTTSTYNKAGDLVSIAESGSYVPGGTTTSKYDKLGRLRMTTDATGFNRYFVYDKAGRMVAEVNHRGDMIEYRYDSNDRLVATARYTHGVTGANLAALADPNSTLEMSALRPSWHPWDIWTWRTYDKEGRLTSTMDGTIRTYEYDSSGRLTKTVAYYNGLDWNQVLAFQANPPTAPVIPAADPRDSVARNFYDKAGRLVAALDGEGYLTRNLYDRAGRLVEKIAYSTATAVADRTGPLSRLLANQASHADDRRVNFVYDGQGQLRFEIDALNQVTEYRYNSAGQATSTIRHAGSIPAPANYRLATIQALVTSLSASASSAASRRSWSVYDESGRLAYAIGAEGAVTRFSYDNMGQVTKATEFAVSRATTSAPDLVTMNNWAAGQNGNGANRVTRHYYSARGELRYTVDGEGYVSRTDFDAAGRTIGEFRWDDAFAINDSSTIGNVAAATDNSTRWAGKWYTYEFGGPLTDFRNGENNWTCYAYYQNGTQMFEYAPYGGSGPTYFNYDIWGRLTTRSDAAGMPEGVSISFGRDGLGNETGFTDGRNYTTTRTFDHLGRVRTVTDAAGGIVSYEYNAFGEVTKVTDARGNATTSTYDKLGRLLTTTDALNIVTTYSYNEFGDVRTVTRGAAVTTFDYDRAGRVTRITDAEGHYEEYTLDAFGNRINVRNKIGGNIVNAYDRRGLLVAETLPMASYDNLGNVVAWSVTNKFEYDGRRNQTKKVEAFGLAEQRTTTYYYDKADRLVESSSDYVQAIDQASHSALTWVIPSEKFKYDQRGRVIERTDALGARTLYYYDGMSRVSVELGANGTYTAFTYDANGNVLTRRVYGTAVALPAPAGGTPPAAPGGEYRETSYTYDALNRVKTATVANIRTGAWNGSYFATGVGSVTTTFDYDANGNVIRTTDGNGGTSFCFYDKANRKVASVDEENYLTFYTLDGEGNVTQEERFATRIGFGVSTGHDSAWLRSTVAGNAADRITQFGYDRNGRRTSEWRLYINSNYVAGNGALGVDGTHGGIQYFYNGLGQIWQKSFGNGDYVSFFYDAMGRLTQESRTAYTDMNGASVRPTTFYYYNGVNNLTLSRQGGVTPAAGDRLTRYTYGAGGRMTAMTDAAGNTYNYFHDAAGNVLRENYTRTKSDGSSVTEGLLYNRDILGRVTSQALATWHGYWAKGDSQDTEYNVYGEVSRRGVNGGWQEQFAYDGAGQMWRSNSGDGVWRFFVHDGNGNQTLAIESEGANLTGYSLDQALSVATAGGAYHVGGAYIDGVNATINVFDKRGQAVQTRMPQRQLNDTSGTTALNVSRTYTAFGEVASETDARGYATDYLYNTMGRLIEKRSPAVNYTTESGAVGSARPTEYYYYDRAGRMIGTRDANGNLTTRQLLAGTGHDGSEALVTYEYHADGGYVRRDYDVFGDNRFAWDELSRRTDMSYDAMGRLIQQTRPNGLTDYYAYDLLGQRIQHSNNVLQTPIYGAPQQVWVQDGYWDNYYGWVDTSHWETQTPIVGYTPDKELTDYDLQGRVVRQVAFGGDTTTTSYSWNGGIATSGMGTFGGWTETTTVANGRSSTEQTDLFGRQVYKSDLGGHVYSFSYDFAGRLTQRSGTETLTYTWLNTGKVAQSFSMTGSYGADYTRKGTTYGYDAAGNLTSERFSEEGQQTSYWWNPYDYYYEPYTNTWSRTYKNATATYDALNRVVTWAEAGSADMASASTAYEYDLVGNIRRSNSLYRGLDHQGAQTGFNLAQDNWYRYDSMNRLVTKGSLAGGQIVRGYGGADYLYDKAGQRVSSSRTTQAQAYVYDPYYNPYDYYPYNYYGGYGSQYTTVYYDAEVREDYSYDGNGALTSVRIAQGGYTDNGDGTVTATAAPAYAALKASFTNDLMGRVTHQVDWLGDGTNAAYDRTVTLNAKGQVTAETVINKQGADTITTNTSHDYGSGSNYALGAAVSTSAYTYKNGAYQSSSTTNTAYAWYEGAVQSTITTYTTATHTTSLYYDGSGSLSSISISDGRPRSITFVNDANGQAIKRDEADNNYNMSTGGDPHEIWHRFGGKQMGYVGNNGTLETDYATSINNRTRVQGTGAFRFGASYGGLTANFDLSNEAITSYGQGVAAGGYAVRQGDTLETVAAQLWGDNTLWYKLAEANGLSAGQTLMEGQRLIIPAGVMKSHHNASTFKPFDPSETLGDISPTTPQPQKAAKRGGKCGVFGTILLVVIAVAVSVVTYGAVIGAAASISAAGTVTAATGLTAALGATGGAIAAGAIAGVAGSVASQAFGVATGIQDKFSWKGVALAGISGAIGGAFKGVELLQGLGKFTTFANDVARGALTNAATQGVGLAVGLQKKFDFAGVAVAAAVAGGVGVANRTLAGWGVGARAGSHAAAAPTVGNYANQLVSGMAGAIAGGATRSLATGTDFGDNVLAALPDVIGSTIGNFAASKIGSAVFRPRTLIGDFPDDGTRYAGVGDVVTRIRNLLTGRENIMTDYIQPAWREVNEFAADIVVTGQRFWESISPRVNGNFFSWSDLTSRVSNRISNGASWAWQRRFNVDPINVALRAVGAERPAALYRGVVGGTQDFAVNTVRGTVTTIIRAPGAIIRGGIAFANDPGGTIKSGIRAVDRFIINDTGFGGRAMNSVQRTVGDLTSGDPARMERGAHRVTTTGLNVVTVVAPGGAIVRGASVARGASTLRYGDDIVDSIGPASRLDPAAIAVVPDGRAYSVAFQMRLDPSDFARSDSVHFNRANAALDGALRADPAWAAQMDALIPGIQNSVSRTGGRSNPSGWTWHHDVEPGVMQLVPTGQHTSSLFQGAFHPGGRGGYSLWAIPAGAPVRRR